MPAFRSACFIGRLGIEGGQQRVAIAVGHVIGMHMNHRHAPNASPGSVPRIVHRAPNEPP